MTHEIEYLLNRINRLADSLQDDAAHGVTPSKATVELLRETSAELRVLIGGGK